MNLNQDQSKKETINKKTSNSEENESNQELIEIEDKYKFGWSGYAETTNGRFAMLGFVAIILIEFLSQKSFLTWAGIF